MSNGYAITDEIRTQGEQIAMNDKILKQIRECKVKAQLSVLQNQGLKIWDYTVRGEKLTVYTLDNENKKQKSVIDLS